MSYSTTLTPPLGTDPLDPRSLDLITQGSIRITPDSFNSPAEARFSNPHALSRTSQRCAGNSRARHAFMPLCCENRYREIENYKKKYTPVAT